MITQARKRFNSLHINFQLMILLSLLNLQDFVTTKVLIEGGFAREVNPWLNYLIEKTGTVDVILLTKVLALGFMWWIMYGLVQQGSKVVTGNFLKYSLMTLTTFYGAVVLWGAYGIYQALIYTP